MYNERLDKGRIVNKGDMNDKTRSARPDELSCCTLACSIVNCKFRWQLEHYNCHGLPYLYIWDGPKLAC